MALSYTFIDLFAGIGGTRTAFERLGNTCVFSSEWNAFAQKTYMENYGEETLYLTSLGDWELIDAESVAKRSQNVVTLKFDVLNEDLTYDSGDPEAELPVVSADVAYISAGGWPKEMKMFTHANIDSIPADGLLTIDTNGRINYTGPVTAANLSGSNIQITNIIYTL